jgi:hypothetical protein
MGEFDTVVIRDFRPLILDADDSIRAEYYGFVVVAAGAFKRLIAPWISPFAPESVSFSNAASSAGSEAGSPVLPSARAT